MRRFVITSLDLYKASCSNLTKDIAIRVYASSVNLINWSGYRKEDTMIRFVIASLD